MIEAPWLFTAIKFVGAVYLLCLGVQLLLTRTARIAATATVRQSSLRCFVTGAASNINNPKIAVFYFAFLPQFVSPGAGRPTLTILALGLLFALLTFVIKRPLALFSGRLSSWFQSRPNALVSLYRFSGVVMVGLAMRLALARRSEA